MLNIYDMLVEQFLYHSHAYYGLQLNADGINWDFSVTLYTFTFLSLITVRQISSFSVFCSVIQVNGHCLKFVFTVRFKALFIFQKALILQKTSLLQLILNQGRSDLYELQVRSNKNKLLKWKLLCQPWKLKNPTERVHLLIHIYLLYSFTHSVTATKNNVTHDATSEIRKQLLLLGFKMYFLVGIF